MLLIHDTKENTFSLYNAMPDISRHGIISINVLKYHFSTKQKDEFTYKDRYRVIKIELISMKKKPRGKPNLIKSTNK